MVKTFLMQDSAEYVQAKTDDEERKCVAAPSSGLPSN